MAETVEGNRFSKALADYCRQAPLDEKWLLAPTVRVGFQWLDRVARSGQAVLNVRVTTLSHLALHLAVPEMERQGVKYLRGLRAEVLAATVLDRVKREGGGYLSAQTPTSGLTRSLLRAIRDLRMAGLAAKQLRDAAFEVGVKGREIRALLQVYEKELKAQRLVDYADVLRTAIAQIQESPHSRFSEKVMLLPEDQEKHLRGLERSLWFAIPAAGRVVLGVDPSAEPSEEAAADADLLRWVNRPADAPAPFRDGTAAIFRAVGEINEVREVLRRCVEGGIPLDEVELVHTDRDTYVPLIYEEAWRLPSAGQGNVPVTFSEGVPARYARPARALMGWLNWVGEDFPQSVLARMIQDGLLRLETAEAEGLSFTRLAAILRGLPIGNRRERYEQVIDREVAGLQARLAAAGALPAAEDGGQEREAGGAAPSAGRAESRSPKRGAGRGSEPGRRLPGVGQDGQGEPGGAPRRGESGVVEGEEGSEPQERRQQADRLGERITALREIRCLVGDLLAFAGGEDRPVDSPGLLHGALRFLEGRARRAAEIDEYVHQKLVEDIKELAEVLKQGEVPGFSCLEWLAGLPGASPVLGMGPRPGCLHVAHVDNGGHSGRKHTFLIGLDDTRFPGTGAQDPLLLDRERQRISGELPTASDRLARRLGDFAALLARLRGTVTLGYCCRSLADDREMFPSPVVLAAFRILSGEREADPHALCRWLPEPASFAPAGPERCLHAGEWWLWRLCAAQPVEDPEGFVGRCFPHLGRGFRARLARAGDRFTEYDGYVPQAGRDADPTRPDGPVLSASRLEELGSCPLQYFFHRVLGIERPRDYEIDPRVWLDPTEKGELLHRVFRNFMGALQRQGILPEFARDQALLEEILGREIELWKRDKPPPGPGVFAREAREIRQTARIFLQEEEEFCRFSRPLFFEVSLGLPPEGSGSDLDSPEPVTIELSGRKVIRVRGRIDRVDREPGSPSGKSFGVWDYKTGSSWKYRDEKGRKRLDPFHQGRLVQGAVYLAMAEARLRETVSAGARVSRFGYVFPKPGTLEHGERLDWSRETLLPGREVLELLCEMLRRGTFPFTDNPREVADSDYLDAFGNAEEAAAAAKRKLGNPANRELEPFQSLRGYLAGGAAGEVPGGKSA